MMDTYTDGDIENEREAATQADRCECGAPWTPTGYACADRSPAPESWGDAVTEQEVAE